MNDMRIIVTDDLRRQPGGLKLGKLNAGTIVTVSDLQESGWRQVTYSVRGDGWFRAAYMEPVGESEGPEVPDGPENEPDEDPIIGVTVYHQSGATEVYALVPVP